MKTIIKTINTRQNDDGDVMNVTVQYSVPAGHRFNIVEVTTFVDKSMNSMDDITNHALSSSLDILKKIVAHQS